MSLPKKTPLPLPDSPHAEDVARLFAALETDPRCGLPEAEARARLLQFGPNAIQRSPDRPLWHVFLHQFQSPLVWLLCAAAFISAGIHHVGDAIDRKSVV